MKHLLWLAFAPGPAHGARQAPAPPCQAQLVLVQHGNLLHVSGSCRSYLPQPRRYRYELRAQRHTPAGQARTTRRSSFELPAGQLVQLPPVGLPTRTAQHFHLRLLVYDETGRAVAQDSAIR